MKKIRRRLMASSFIIFLLMLLAIKVDVSENNKSEDENKSIVYESENDHNTIISSANASTKKFSRNLGENDKYLLAKIAMAEAEGELLETKILVILTVLNRVESKEFPNTVEEVILQNRNGVYQFTPVANGRFDRVEPNEECLKAVEIVNGMESDASKGALYFEACLGESWHSRNLELICKSSNTRFYK